MIIVASLEIAKIAISYSKILVTIKCPSIGYWLNILLCLIIDKYKDLDGPQSYCDE